MLGVAALRVQAGGFAPAVVAPPRAPVLANPAPTETRAFFKQASLPQYGKMAAAPPLLYVADAKDDLGTVKLNRDKPGTGKSVPNYNTEPGAELKRGWGVGVSSNGRRVENIYGNAKVPTVGDRPTEVSDMIDRVSAQPKSYNPTKSAAFLMGNDKYEQLKNGLKAEVTVAKDQQQRLGLIPKLMLETPSMDTTSSSAVALAGALLGTGVMFALHRFGFGQRDLSKGEELLIGA